MLEARKQGQELESGGKMRAARWFDVGSIRNQTAPRRCVATANIMSRAAFEQFREAVLKDTVLQQRLQEPADFKTFLPLAIELGQERGLEFSQIDIEEAAREGRRAWLERWI